MRESGAKPDHGGKGALTIGGMKHWTLDDISWDRFDPAKVDAELLAVVKAASLVEANAGAYAVYLCNVFADDPEFQDAARNWALEEVQHGRALGRWAELADPNFDFAAAFRRFTDGYKLPLEATQSVRGSRAAELIARCVVETGTSSYYTALGDAADEPVLKNICRRIAADEFRHYKLFYKHMKRYLPRERLNFLARIRVALSRMIESEDDELAYAYHAANFSGPYDRERCVRAYACRAYAYYRPHHVERAVSMALKAVGASGSGRLARVLSAVGYWFMKSHVARLAAADSAR